MLTLKVEKLINAGNVIESALYKRCSRGASVVDWRCTSLWWSATTLFTVQLQFDSTSHNMRIGATVPNFKADSTQGPIELYDWQGDS